jgi:hypothetical protein
MRTFILYCCLLGYSLTAFAKEKSQEVNAILHDQSYIVAFGKLPDASTSEQLRIRIHLSYTEQLLRSASVQKLTALQLTNRLSILDLLHQYMLAGNFPVNKDYPGERKPCFIDAGGNICAVGYLIEQTKGRQLAEAINAKHQYDLLLNMHEQVIEEWATEYGLTLEECAMIQPTYGSSPPSNQVAYADIKKAYGVSSGLIGGVNIAANMVNLSAKGNHNATMPYIGLAAGIGQVIIGIVNIKHPVTAHGINQYPVTTSYKAQNNLSYVNIALGTTTIITSTLNLLMNRKNSMKRNAVNLYSYPTYNNSLSMGLCFTRRI